MQGIAPILWLNILGGIDLSIVSRFLKKNTADEGIPCNKKDGAFTVALAGNPNVGKSTVFNALTGMNQHTGNWPGKTVSCATGSFKGKEREYVMVDIPGTYSLMAHSAEEEAARNYLCFGAPDAVIVVCDATCLERNMNLVLQTIEVAENVILCVNLMDEAARKGISVDLGLLSERLGVPVVGTQARRKKSLAPLIEELDGLPQRNKPYKIKYSSALETAIAAVEPAVLHRAAGKINSRWLSLRLLDADEALKKEISDYLGSDFFNMPELRLALVKAREILDKAGIGADGVCDEVVRGLVKSAEDICRGAVKGSGEYCNADRRLDRLLTSRLTGYPVMILLLIFVFWLTVTGANYPSELLSGFLFGIQDKLYCAISSSCAPEWLCEALVMGIYRVLAWVVSVMLPPMAIFFPLFTLLEDSGYLPRIAYNLDKPFRMCNACGKQALTMCMGFGCNAAGVIGCRIIDSPRERLLAVLTNSLVPCNGRFPTMILIITIFFVGTAGGLFSSVLASALLTGVILLGVLMTFAATKLLSKTVLKGVPSSFTLELPSYRKPQIAKTLVRSIFDRTLFVLGRAAAVAAPAGLIIWLAANISIAGATLIEHFSGFLDPLARLMGLDGVILMAFILGFPANEIVVPIILMAYSALGSLPELGSAADIGAVFIQNGWTRATALCVILFSLMHWPCSTTLITVKKETGSLKYAFLAAALPTAMGIVACIIVTEIARVTGFA